MSSGVHCLHWYSVAESGWRSYSFHLGTIEDVALDRATEIMGRYRPAQVASLAVLKVGLEITHMWSRQSGWVVADFAPASLVRSA